MVHETEQTRRTASEPGPGVRPRHRRSWPGIVLAGLVTASGLVAGLVAGPPSSALAQATADCAIPEAQPPLATPASTPETDPDAIIIAPVRRGVSTPVAEAAATPVSIPLPTPDPLAPLTAELTDVAHALAACLSAGDAELISTLATERYLGQLYGGDTPLSRDDYLALAADLDPVPTVIRTITDIAPDGDDRATARITSVVGRQLLVSRWSFVQAPAEARADDESRWQVDREEPLPFAAPGGAPLITVGIEDYAFDLSETTVTGPEVVLSGRNSAGQDHEMLVLRLDDGLTTQDLLRGSGPGLPEGITYVGQATVPAATRVDLVLVDLEPGAYTVVCYFLTADGIPHLALGMEASFTVEE